MTKNFISDSNYIQYYTKSSGVQKGAEVLVISAHGGFFDSDKFAPVVVLPSAITIQILTPHGTMLVDPGLDHVVNAGENLKAYVTITKRKITNVDFLPQKGNPRWLYTDDYDPMNIHNTLGSKYGLHNYRHLRFEREDELLIASVIIKNREQVKKKNAVLTDILTVDHDVSYLPESSLKRASVQKVLDIDKEGKLTNEKGKRYKKIVFCHCRSRLQPPYDFISSYIMVPSDLENVKKQIQPKGFTFSDDVKMTVLYREDINKPFEIQRLTIGRFIFIPVQQSIQGTKSPKLE